MPVSNPLLTFKYARLQRVSTTVQFEFQVDIFVSGGHVKLSQVSQLPREVIHSTLDAGSMFGTGAVELKTPPEYTGATNPTTSTSSHESCVSTRPSRKRSQPLFGRHRLSQLIILLCRLSLPSHHHPFLLASDGSTQAIPTPAPSAPVSSGATALVKMFNNGQLTLVALGLYFFVI